jgi:hypothetical protein
MQSCGARRAPPPSTKESFPLPLLLLLMLHHWSNFTIAIYFVNGCETKIGNSHLESWHFLSVFVSSFSFWTEEEEEGTTILHDIAKLNVLKMREECRQVSIISCGYTPKSSTLFPFLCDGSLWLTHRQTKYSYFEHSQNRIIVIFPYELGICRLQK